MSAHRSLGAESFRVKVWCRDCCGQDFLGCFDGGSDFIYDGREVQQFTSLEDAKRVGEEYVDSPPWEFAVVNEDDEEVYRSDA